MKVSYWKIATKYLFGGKEAVLDYILDLANNAVAALNAGTKEKLITALHLADNILDWMDRLLVFCPAKWRGAWNSTTLALAAVTAAAQDLEITADELKSVSDKFAVAYAAWRTPEEGELLSALAEETAKEKETTNA